MLNLSSYTCIQVTHSTFIYFYLMTITVIVYDIFRTLIRDILYKLLILLNKNKSYNGYIIQCDNKSLRFSLYKLYLSRSYKNDYYPPPPPLRKSRGLTKNFLNNLKKDKYGISIK